MGLPEGSLSDCDSEKRCRSITKYSKKFYSRHFLQSWFKTFQPWISRDPDDYDKPYCKVCKSSLNCNTCHLKRHSLTVKHRAHLAAALNGGDVNALKLKIANRPMTKKQIEALLPKKSDQHKKSSNSMESKMEFADDVLDDFQILPDEANNDHHSYTEGSLKELKISPMKESKMNSTKDTNLQTGDSNNMLNILSRIKKDRKDLFDSCSSFLSQTAKVSSSPPKEKDHLDYFFESVVLSVKCLSPKLIAEAKLRVSQMIGELELRQLAAIENVAAQAYGESNKTENVQSNDASNSTAYYISHPGVVFVENNTEHTVKSVSKDEISL